MKITSCLSFAVAITAGAAGHAQSCQVRVLQPITDDLGNRWRPGQMLPVDIARDEAGRRSFCAHGGACMPVTANGSPSVRLTNCLVGGALGGGDYRLVPDPHVMGAATAARMTKRDRVESRLSDLGLSNASAGTYAEEYVQRPASADGRLVARALRGSKAAFASMQARLP